MIMVDYKKGDDPEMVRHEVLDRKEFRSRYGVNPIFSAFERTAHNGDVLEITSVQTLEHFRMEIMH